MLPKRSKTVPKTCEFCGVEFVPFRQSKGRFCSVDHSNKYRIGKPGISRGVGKCIPKETLEKIKDLYRGGLFCRQIAARFGYHKELIVDTLKHLGIFDPSRKAPHLVKKPYHQRDPNQFLKYELREHRLGDELTHWGNHPEVLRWRANEVAKRQFHKWKLDPQKKVKRILRCRLWKVLSLQAAIKSQRTFNLVGCSPSALVAHIENQFELGMSWDNYGSHWEVDHIRPCASFNLTDPDQQAQCFHFSNLRPLPKTDNRQKSSQFRGLHHRHKKPVKVMTL